MIFDPESVEIQEILSHILKKPSLTSQEIIQIVFPQKKVSEQIDILTGVREVIETQLKTKIEKSLPKPIHHLRFCWNVLRQADSALRFTKSEDFPVIIKPDDLKIIFNKVFPINEIHNCLMQQLCLILGLDPNGGFIKHYSKFLKSTKLSPLEIQIKDSEGRIIKNNLRRLIYWIIRKNRYKYIEPDKESGRIIHFPYLSNYVKEELSKWCKEDDLPKVDDLIEEIENQINLWLEYNCLDGDNLPPEISELKELAKSFIKENLLKGKIFIPPASQDPQKNRRIFELESELSKYAEEIRRLENDVQKQKKRDDSSDKDKELEIKEKEEINSLSSYGYDLLEFLRIIDSKYSFDILRSVQLGDEKNITIKNFLAHLFYSLRKKGVVTYPSENEFELTYEQSGLYNCIGFEVPPDGKATVKTEKPGWALSKGGRIYPIKKAVLRLA